MSNLLTGLTLGLFVGGLALACADAQIGATMLGSSGIIGVWALLCDKERVR